MNEIKRISQDATKKLAEVVAEVVKTYIGLIISEKLKPKIIDSIKGALDDAKADTIDKDKKVEKDLKDSLPTSAPGVDEPDLFKFVIAGSPDSGYVIDWPAHSGNAILGYEVNCVRVANEKSGLLALARHYKIRYGQWLKLTDKLREEKKDIALPVIPPEYIIGTYCGCRQREWQPWHLENMRTWVDGVNKVVGPSSQIAADHFYMGANYENQQIFKAIFDKTMLTVARHFHIRWYPRLPPFDEGEGVSLLCQLVLVDQFLPQITAKLPNALHSRGAGTLYALVDAAMASGWAPAQKVINEVKQGIGKVIDDGGDALAAKLKDLFQGVLAVVQEKMKKDEKKAEEEEKEPVGAIGSVIKDWKFDKTDVGKKYSALLLDAEKWGTASGQLQSEWKPAMETFFSQAFTQAISNACNPKFASSSVMQIAIQEFARYIGNTFRRFSTVTPLIEAAKALEKLRGDLVAEIAKDAKDFKTVEATINRTSNLMWQSLPTAGLQLFSELRRVESDLYGDLKDSNDDALRALSEVVAHMYHIQMRALNALRVNFTIKLKAKLQDDANRASEAKIGESVRQVFRDELFPLVDAVVAETWGKLVDALTATCVAIAQNKFFSSDVWSGITGGLSALQSKIPDGPLKDKLDLPSLAQTVVETILEKGVTKLSLKIFYKLEGAIFKQA